MAEVSKMALIHGQEFRAVGQVLVPSMWLFGLPRSMVAGFQEEIDQETGETTKTFYDLALEITTSSATFCL